jgi:DNA polymerase-3 subunit epsilon
MFRAALDRIVRAGAGLRRAAPLDAPPDSDLVVLDTETTSLDRRKAEILAIGAIRIRGNRLMTSQSLRVAIKPRSPVPGSSIRIHGLRTIDLAHGVPVETALERLTDFAGARPLVGYYLEFDLAVINRALAECAGQRLANPRIEISSLYYDYTIRQRRFQPIQGEVDLSFDSIMANLKLPRLPKHDPINDAIMTGLAYLKLRHLMERMRGPTAA